MNIGKSHLFGYLKNMSINNMFSSFVHIGQINIDVPLRPMIVHGVVYRESKVIEQKFLPEIKNFAIFENADESLKDDKQQSPDKLGTSTKYSNRQGDKDFIKTSSSFSQFDKQDTIDSNHQSDKKLHYQNSSKIKPFQSVPTTASQQTITLESETLNNMRKAQSKKKHQLSVNNENAKKASLTNLFFSSSQNSMG